MIKRYLDEDVHKKVATALRLKGYDAISAHEIGETVKRLAKFLFSHPSEEIKSNIYWI